MKTRIITVEVNLKESKEQPVSFLVRLTRRNKPPENQRSAIIASPQSLKFTGKKKEGSKPASGVEDMGQQLVRARG